MTRATSLSLLALLPFLSACGGGGEAASTAFAGTIDTVGGAVHVRSPAAGMWAAGKEWKLVEELRIGSAEEEGPALLGEVGALEVDPLGRVWVMERQAREIRVFDAAGRHVRSFGRKGGGPGEFQDPAAMWWSPRGQLWTLDQGTERFTVFDTAGALVTTHRREGMGITFVPWPGGADPAGNVYDVGMVRDGSSNPFGKAVLVRLDTALLPRDTFALPRHESEQFEMTRGRSFFAANVPYTPRLEWKLDAQGSVWMGVSDRYRLARVGFGGDTTLVVERAWEPEPVSGAERDSALAGLKWFTDQGGKVDASRIPSTKPAFASFFSDDRGFLWVEPVVGEDEQGKVLDVFDPQGRYLGRVRSPVRIRGRGPLLARGDRIWTVARDEMDVPYVVRLRIVGR